MVCFFSSLNFYHSISVTHHSSLITLNTTPVWHHHSISITQYFSHYLWAPYLSLIAGFFFFQYANSPNLVKKEEEKKPSTDRSERKKKKKKKKKNRTANQEKKGKKKVKSGQKLVLVLFVGPLCVFNYNIVIEL